ncbi:hypothetical protein [Cellulosimicrobium composti]|uniref:Uncharacterized protein n=1 Tax=Cellulosimicrobium composti TaxID=2672572 RepID=A0ABX0B5Y8_9MICO|nr:hypothetical protein [Cellulosimicrobium composti]NDO88208.1 hypothetical protein [Cellulosimicrobium composti]
MRSAPRTVGATSTPTYAPGSVPSRRVPAHAAIPQTTAARASVATASAPFQRGGVTWMPSSSLRVATTTPASPSTTSPAATTAVPTALRSLVQARRTATSATAPARWARSADGPATRRLQNPARYSSGPVADPPLRWPARATDTRSSNRTCPARARRTRPTTTATGTSESTTARAPGAVRASPSSADGTRAQTWTVSVPSAPGRMHRAPTMTTATVVTAAVSRRVSARPKTRTAAAVGSGRACGTLSPVVRTGAACTAPSSAPGTRRDQYATFASPNGTLSAHSARVSPRRTAPTTPASGRAP